MAGRFCRPRRDQTRTRPRGHRRPGRAAHRAVRPVARVDEIDCGRPARPSPEKRLHPGGPRRRRRTFAGQRRRCRQYDHEPCATSPECLARRFSCRIGTMNRLQDCRRSTMTPPSGCITVRGGDIDPQQEAAVRIAVPREIKKHEYRVALTPAGVHELTGRGHDVFVETDAGLGSSITDEEDVAAGAKVLATAAETWAEGELILKVKEPIAAEYPHLRAGQVLFTYLHIAADRPLTDALLASGTTAIAYETVQTASGALPLLAPMSEVAGRLAPQVGAYSLMKPSGGRGVLPGGI